MIHFLLCLRLDGMEVPPASNTSRKRPVFHTLIVAIEDQKKKKKKKSRREKREAKLVQTATIAAVRSAFLNNA